jgi:hypothetical protein
MSIKIEIIKVILDINLPKSTKVYLTKNLFYFPSSEKKGGNVISGGANSNYPFFTFDSKYSSDKLKSISSYKDRVSCFFNDNLFRKILTDQQTDVDDNDLEENAKYNVMCMLSCMFPTHFPIESNLQGSFDTRIEGNYFSNPDFIFQDSQFSYIRLNSGVYTVNRVCWVNDIINNNSYRKLVDSVIEYNKLELNKKTELEKNIETISKKYTESLKNFKSKNINEFYQLISDIRNAYSSSSSGRSGSRDYILYQKYINNIERKINELKGSDKDNSIAIVIGIHNEIKLLEKSEFRRYFDNNEFAQLYESAKSLNSEKIILDILENPEHKKKYKDNKSVVDKLAEYSNLSDVVKSVKKYSTPYQVTSNKQLQNLIEAFVHGSSSSNDKNLRDFISYIKNRYLDKKNVVSSVYSTNFLHSGVVLTNLPYKNKKSGELNNRTRDLKIRVKINVFKGVITSSNIFCVNRNAVLENMYKHLTEHGDDSKNVDLEDQSHLYLDMTKILSEKKGGRKTLKHYTNKNRRTSKYLR